jgi:hypothetical protein
MAISQQMMLAILAMDSYNREYGHGLDVVAAGASATQIGNASINATPDSVNLAAWQAAGFFAQSYTLNGQTIIAYRGNYGDTPLNYVKNRSCLTSVTDEGVRNNAAFLMG